MNKIESPTPLAVISSSGAKIALAELLEAHIEPAILLDRDYTILASNSAYRQRYGLPSAGTRCYQSSHRFTQPCDQAGESCPLQSALASGQRERVLHLHHTAYGEEHVDVELHPLRDRGGEIVAFLERLTHTSLSSAQPAAEGLVGRSSAFNQMMALVHRVADSGTAVLLLGESGTGKELVAQAIHRASARAAAPLVTVECSGLSEGLFESELFGHEKGAFTGALARKPGLVEAADGGTLFLDEVGDIPLPMQVKLLRLIESGSYRRVGSTEPRRTDFRLICATHRDLAEMVEAGAFRRDLYYRINPFPIQLPPLRERRADLPLLIRSLLQTLGAPELNITAEAMQQLERYPFPGNIRELRNLLERAILLCNGEINREHLLPNAIIDGAEAAQRPAIGVTAAFNPDDIVTLDALEARYLRWARDHFAGDRRALAARLGVSERTLYRKLKQLE